ncbi:MAG: serine/threonine protein kinase [Myxococcaceae bacterium]
MAEAQPDARRVDLLPPDPHRGRRVGGKYQVLSQLSAGGMAEIFLAFTAGPGGFRKYVVVKQILPDVRGEDQFRKMFLDEARITAQFSHPNIGQVFDLGEDEEGLYLAMEFVAGQNVNQVYRAAQRKSLSMPIGFSCALARDVCLALHYAHTFTDPLGRPFPIIHRDIAQKNVMVTFEGVTKLLDFGIAQAKEKLNRTSVGHVKGTTGYMSPEQTRGDPLDARTDLFSVGVMLHELVTGQRLFAGETEEQEMQNILSMPIPRPMQINPDLPEALDRVIMRALARERSDRYSTAKELAKAIEQAAGKLMYDADQSSQFMRELFEQKMAATRQLLESAVSDDFDKLQSAMNELRQDEGMNFPSKPTRKPTVETKADGAQAEKPRSSSPKKKRKDSGEMDATSEQQMIIAHQADAAAEMPTRRSMLPWVIGLVLFAAVALYFVTRLSDTLDEKAPIVPPPKINANPLGLKEFAEPVPPGSQQVADNNSQGNAQGNSQGSAQQNPQDVAKEPAKAKPMMGALTLVTMPEAEVFRNGTSLGKTPLFRLPMPVGVHLLKLKGPDGKVHNVSAKIEKDKTAAMKLHLDDLP